MHDETVIVVLNFWRFETFVSMSWEKSNDFKSFLEESRPSFKCMYLCSGVAQTAYMSLPPFYSLPYSMTPHCTSGTTDPFACYLIND